MNFQDQTTGTPAITIDGKTLEQTHEQFLKIDGI